jgi:hypothetical protein
MFFSPTLWRHYVATQIFSLMFFWSQHRLGIILRYYSSPFNDFQKSKILKIFLIVDCSASSEHDFSMITWFKDHDVGIKNDQ